MRPAQSVLTAPPRPGWATQEPPRLGVSNCRLGDRIRHERGRRRPAFLTERLARYVEWVPVCAGIGIGLAGYVLATRTPGCGPGGVCGFPRIQPDRDRDADPLTAAADRLAWLPVEEEGQLGDPALREHFVERVFAHARLIELFGSPWRLSDLVDFHTRHKLQLFAHSPHHARTVGRLVAAADRPRETTEAEYRRLFTGILAVRAGRPRNCDAMTHALGHLRDHVNGVGRRDLLAQIEAYRRSEVPLSLPVGLLTRHAHDGEVGYLTSQTYLDPYPGELGLRDHI